MCYRNLITLPHLDQTADKVFGRIIPAPNGDCKLVAYPGDQNFPDYGIKINGLPYAIACGLTASINIDGTAVPIDPGNKNNPQLGSTGDQSTDGQGGSYVAPPPAAPFKPLDPKDYPCFYNSGGSQFCVPAGKYFKQSGMGWEIGDMVRLSLPSDGWYIDTEWQQGEGYGPGRMPKLNYQTIDRSFKSNIDPNTNAPGFSIGSAVAAGASAAQAGSFSEAMKGIANSPDGTGWFRAMAPSDGPDDVCCLFTEANFGGNVLCLGVGGGDLPSMWQNKAKSASCHNGANMWLYAASYGDIGGAVIKGDVTDLASEPYGKDKDTFSERTKAIWVLKPQ